ncbi:MAG: hypothetical protein ACE5HP_06765 [Gemmatimonadota bacterium]
MSDESAMHLSMEQLSELLDAAAPDPVGRAHLDRCGECRGEFERLSRMRMALSGLGDMDPPVGQWRRIQEALDARGIAPRPPVSFLRRWPVQVAAGFLLFAGGIVSGLQMTGAGPTLRSRDGAAPLEVTRSPDAREARQRTDRAMPGEPESAYLGELTELARLPGPGLAASQEPLDPAAAAEQLARLQALIEASREALESAPADPVANDLLFRLLEERDHLAWRLNRSVSLVSLEYR